jgi:hypothetical protein
MKKHVFLFQVHKEAGLFDRILSALEADNHYFIINIDLKSNEINDIENVIQKHNNIVYVTKKNIIHGGFSQIECTLEQLEFALNYKETFEVFHSLSGQDYPCLPNSVIDDVFEGNRKSFMMFDTDEECMEWRKNKYSKRLEHFYFNDLFRSAFCRKFHIAGILNKLFYFVPRKYHDLDLIWGGWNWFSLQRQVIQYLLNYVKENPSFVKRFRYTHCGDELFYTSILFFKTDELNIEKRNSLRYIDWHPNRSYTTLPLILNELDFDKIVESKCIFCRKVEINESGKLIESLDRRIEGEKINYIRKANKATVEN